MYHLLKSWSAQQLENKLIRSKLPNKIISFNKLPIQTSINLCLDNKLYEILRLDSIDNESFMIHIHFFSIFFCIKKIKKLTLKFTEFLKAYFSSLLTTQESLISKFLWLKTKKIWNNLFKKKKRKQRFF